MLLAPHLTADSPEHPSENFTMYTLTRALSKWTLKGASDAEVSPTARGSKRPRQVFRDSVSEVITDSKKERIASIDGHVPGGLQESSMNDPPGYVLQYSAEMEQKIRRLTETNIALRNDSESSQKAAQQAKEEIRIYQGRMLDIDKDKTTLEARIRIHEQDQCRLRIENGRISERKKMLEDRERHLHGENKTLKERNQVLEEDLARCKRELGVGKQELESLQMQLTQNMNLLEARTRELQGAGAFLATTDIVSGADVARVTENLNAEILETAAFMADSFKYGSHGVNAKILADAKFRAAHYVGTTMVNYLQRKRHDQDPTLLQIALQSCMALFCVYITSSWTFSNPRRDDFLNDLCAKLQQTEIQPVASRWRALSRRHVRQMQGDDVTVSLQVISDIEAALGCILFAAGCEDTSIHKAFMRQFNNRLSTIISGILRLNKIIGQDVISCDIYPSIVSSGAIFDPNIMSNADGRPKAPQKSQWQGVDRVVCMTHMGLRRTEKITKDGQASTDMMILLKPKVVLHSTLEGIIAEEGL